MLSSSGGFLASSLSIPHNAIKSLIFTAAQGLLAMAVYMFFSLIAAKANFFTSYLMFMEDIVQKAYFVFSRGFSINSVLVLCFAIIYAAASLYGTLLWGLDAPGYVMHGKTVAASTVNSWLLEDPAYIVYIDAKQNNLATIDTDLPQLIGANLFKPGLNFTLTPVVDRGFPKATTPTQSKVGGRIWLDDEGFSVSPNTQAIVSSKTDTNGRLINMDCPVKTSAQGVQNYWNCTPSNTLISSLLISTLGAPEVHWDDSSDRAYNSRLLIPDRKKNIWAAFGQGGGTAVMKQMLTVTKGTRRHTFIETAFRSTMFAMPNVPFSSVEVADLLERTWSKSRTEQEAAFILRLSNSIIGAQKANVSFMYGANDASNQNLTATQFVWEYLTPEVNGRPAFSIIRISMVNITLVRSETIAVAPKPFEKCDLSFMNLAYGGVVSDTDCSTAKIGMKIPQFFGQVDTSAVLILYGLGDGRSNISSEALNETIYTWTLHNSERMNDLLLSRGFIVGVDSSLVTIEVRTLKPAMSYLQMLLVLVALLLAAIGWISLRIFASSHWSSTFLQNLLNTTATTDEKSNQSPGYINPVPQIKLRHAVSQSAIEVDNSVVRLCISTHTEIAEQPYPIYSTPQPDSRNTTHERQLILSQQSQHSPCTIST